MIENNAPLQQIPERNAFVLARRGPVVYVEARGPLWPAYAAHGFCTRHAGVSGGPYASLNVGDRVGDDLDCVRENIHIIKDTFGIAEAPLFLPRQVHGNRIVEISGDEDPLSLPSCDGLLTDRPGIALGIKTADCVPILFADRGRAVVGAAHAGWRGTVLGIAARMVGRMVNRYGSGKQDIVALIGPAVGACCYEVDAPVFEAFSGVMDMDTVSRRLPDGRHWLIDLKRANALQLTAAGIPADNILVADFCTACRNDLFYSHRAAGGKAEGRQLNVVALSPTS